MIHYNIIEYSIIQQKSNTNITKKYVYYDNSKQHNIWWQILRQHTITYKHTKQYYSIVKHNTLQ